MITDIYNPKQIQALESDARILVLHGAKRSGKTYALIVKFVAHVLKFKNKGYKFIIGGTDAASIRTNVLDDLFILVGEKHIKNDKSFTMFGNKILLRAGKNSDSWKGARGFTAHGALLNEGTALHDRFIKECISRCSGEGSRVFIDTNPENPMHTVKTDYIDKAGQKLENGELNIDEIQFKLDDNTFLDPIYKESIKMSTPSGMFTDRDILGLWVNAEGVVYRDFVAKKHMVKSMPESETVVQYIGGIDWGYEHYGSIVVFAHCDSGNYYLVHETTRKHEQVQDFWLPLALKLVEKYKGIYFFTETARPEYTHLFADNDIDMILANKSVVPGIQHVASLFKTDNLFLIESAVEMIDKELCSYVWSSDKKEEKPNKDNDDCLDAVRYALYTHYKSTFNGTFEI